MFRKKIDKEINQKEKQINKKVKNANVQKIIQKNKKIQNNKNKQVNNIHTKKLPIFMIIGFAILTLLIVGIYYLFLNFKEIAILDYEGYAISGKEITETLLGNNSEEDNNKKNLFLTKVYEQDKLYKKVNDYFV